MPHTAPADPGALPQRSDLNVLRTFLAVYRAGSFTAAAPQVGLSQPSVTTQIRALEQQMRRELFVRGPHGVVPTESAHELASQVSAPLDQLATFEGAPGVPAGRAAPVRLAGPSELLCTRVLPPLAGLVASGVKLRVTQGLTEPLLDDLRAGRQDLLVSTRRPRGRGLASTPLMDQEYVLVASPSWAARLPTDDAASLALALRAVPLVAYSEDMPMVRRYWRNVFGENRPPTAAAVTVPNLHAVMATVAAGAGYSVVPQSVCEEHLDRGLVVPLVNPEEPPLNTFFLVRGPGAENNPDLLRVSDALVEAAKQW